MSKAVFAGLAKLQRAAALSISYHDEVLSEAIMHHCALRTASATAESDEMVSRYARAEERQFRKLLRMKVADLEGIAVRGRYVRAYVAYDPDVISDAGVPEALLDGMARPAK